MIRLIALDLDGTLLDDKKKLSPQNRRAVSDAVKAGFRVIGVTGRHYAGAMQVLCDLPEITDVITCNGAALYEIPGKLVTEYPFEDSVIYPLMRRLGELDIIVDAFCDGLAYADTKSRPLFMALDIPDPVKQYILKSRVYVNHLTDYLQEHHMHVHKLTINFPGDGHGGWSERDRTMRIALEGGLEPVSGGVGNMELTRSDVTKGRMLCEFAARAGIKREEIMAFGDSGNDIAMLKAAGVGIAMANATPDVKQAADRVAKSNEENGVADEIGKLLNS